MPYFADATVTGCVINALKGEMRITLTVPLAEGDDLADAYELRRLHDMGNSVVADIHPLVVQKSLFPSDHDRTPAGNHGGVMATSWRDAPREDLGTTPEPAPEPETRDISEQIDDLFRTDDDHDPLP